MKGKLKNLKYVFVLLAMLTAGICFAFNTVPNKEQVVYAAHNIFTVGSGDDEKKFSAKFAGDVIFSVEKVKVSSSFDDNNYGLPNNLGDGYTVFKGGEQELENKITNVKEKVDVKYTFDASNKEVAQDGQFLRFDNVIANDAENTIQTKYDPNVQEAIIVSFGAYVYDPENQDVVLTNKGTPEETDDVYAGITYLEVVAYHNNKEIQTPKVRNILYENTSENKTYLYFDFAQIILQEEDNSNEGFYQYSVRYMVDFVEYVENFSFYLVNNTSYTTVLNNEFGYSALPTLGWTDDGIPGGEFAKSAPADDNYTRYKIGLNGVYGQTIAYPTITFDYTRFKLSYTHNANQKNTTYTYEVSYQNTVNNQTATLTCLIDNGNERITKTQELYDYNKDAKTNLITIMLTEPGTYVAKYEYLYRGYNSASAPQTGFETTDIRLSIHGFSAYYTKANVEGAKLQYYTIATKLGNSVDLFIPNGYEYSSTGHDRDRKLGFAYVLETAESNEEEISREGNIIFNKSQDAMINHALTSSVIDKIDEYNLTSEEDIDGSKYESVSGLLNNMVYVQTNQGSLWIEGNDTYTSKDRTLLKSFYYYSTNRITADLLYDSSTYKTKNFHREFSNTTSFNQKGYYLVFIKVEPAGYEENKKQHYYQVFAFQYTSSAVNLTLETIDENGEKSVLEGGKFTNKDVQISWLTPGVFDRKISAFYYSSTNRVLNKDELLLTTKHVLEFNEQGALSSALLGKIGTDSAVAQGNFSRFLIRLESEGQTATHKMFTIDRQDISGLQPYLIQEMYSGGAVFYAYATNSNNNYIPINNSITEGYATLTWNDKASGANIVAKYSYTPFASNTDNITLKTGVNGSNWVTTNYQLGTTISGSELIKARYPHDVLTDSVLFNQGIYLFTLTDEAGNSCKYAFIIDRTSNYFIVNDTQEVSNGLFLSGEDVKYTTGDYKAFRLNTQANGFDEYLFEFIEKAQAGELDTFDKYYVGINNNTEAISRYFQKDGDGNYFFTVQNHRVEAYDTEEKIDTSIRAKTGTLTYVKESGATYYKRTLYVISENHTNSLNNVKTHSFATIEINTDNALGMVYYSGGEISEIPANGEDDKNNQIYRLDTGSDDIINDATAFNKMHATNANHLAFVWNVGTGIFEVEKVEFSHYTLNFETYTDKCRFYDFANGITTTVYDSSTELAQPLGDGRMVYAFNVGSLTREGLYVVTRYYKNYSDEVFGTDVGVKNYYFVVDRNGIIDLSNGIGENIKLWLKEEETPFSEFSKSGVEYVSNFDFVGDNGQVRNAGYNIYLKTTKLPAVMKLPLGKYFNAKGSSENYYAGQLKVSIYFDDVKTQLPAGDEYRNKQLKIFEGDITVNKDGYFTVDIYSYLVETYGLSSSLVSRLAMIDEDKRAWLFLSGNYVVHIRDNVQNKGLNVGYHEKFIGFQIDGVNNAGPQIEVKTGASQNSDQLLSVNMVANSATVSQEFLKVTLPKYIEGETKKAQVDPDYIIITQIIDGRSYPYLTCEYAKLSDFNREYIKYNEDVGTFDVWLDTLLRNKDNQIDTANLSRSLKYQVAFRYDLNNANGVDNERFKNCYFYFDSNGKKVYYYQTTYTIEIDRQAPTENINNLNHSDAMVKEYSLEFGTQEMFTNAVYEKSKLYFTRQYAKYYLEKDKGSVDYSKYLYVYLVNDNTDFSNSDIANVYVKSFNPVADKLTLPFAQDGYEKTNVNNSITSYTSLTGITNPGYYEIVEEDFAGNVTQYVIGYNYSPADFTMTINIIPTNSNDTEQNISFATTNAINAFKINGAENASFENDYFFKIQLLRNGNLEHTWLTNTATNFLDMGKDVVKKINEVATSANGSGNFNLNVTTRTNKTNVNINLYNSESIRELDIEDLVDKTTDPFTIKLNGANVYDISQELWFYATRISIQKNENTQTYVASYFNGEIEYYDEADIAKVHKIETIECDDNTTYILTMETVLGEDTTYRFNSSGHEFVVVTFDNHAGYRGEGNNQYYGYSSAELMFDQTVYSAQVFKKNSGLWEDFNATISSIDQTNYLSIYLPEDYNEEAGTGTLVEYQVVLQNVDEQVTYHFIIDKSLCEVILKDSKGDTKDIISVYDNIAFDNADIAVRAIGSGILTLNWSELSNDYFDYAYILHELKNPTDADSFVKTVVTGKYVHQINTQEGSSGYYRLEVRVYEKGLFDEQDLSIGYLGNRVFAFEVKRQGGNIYFVRNSDNIDVLPNSSFTKKEILGVLSEEEKTAITINENSYVDLYISTDELEIVIAMDQIIKTKVIEKYIGADVFYVYKITKKDGEFDLYSVYVGILKIRENNNLVNDVKVVGSKTQDVGHSTDFILAEKDSSVAVTFKVQEQTNVILKKNLLLMDVYYMNAKVKTVPVQEIIDSKFSFEIEGSGKYSFEIKDLAGNVHKYINGDDMVDVTVMKEVVVTINSQAPIAHAIYNSDVELSIYNSAIYNAGSVKVQAFRNGQSYLPNGQNPTYFFRDYGTYRVVITATYTNSERNYNLRKVVYFTILNIREARASIDLTSLGGYSLIQVFNTDGKDVTDGFKSMMNKSATGGTNITYDNVMQNSKALEVVSGKVTFTCKYIVENGIYPPREMLFSFTLNDETPKIECTLNAGETTKKSFDIFFNPAIIFEQVGEASVYINGKLVASIDENSSNGEVRISRSFKEDGDGDYYITLVSSSGVVLDAYKVEIKEPLNTWAIIVIIVVVGVVLTVVITIIVLRRKMRIR